MDLAKYKHKIKNLPRYKFIIDENDIESGIRLVSIVEDPAIEVKGMYFSKNNQLQNFEFKTNQEKQMLVGPFLIPNFDIYRNDSDGEYYGFFDAPEIEKMFNKFVRTQSNFSINVDHSSRMVDGYIQSLYLIRDSVFNNARYFGFDLPVGTLFGEVKILDKQFWENDIKKEGKTGFSIEGMLSMSPIKLQQTDYSNHTDEEFLNELTDEEVMYLSNLIKNPPLK